MKNFKIIAILLLWASLAFQGHVRAQGTFPPVDTIFTLNDLQWLSENDTAWDNDWVLGADIDAAETSTWNSGEGFSPIGNLTTNYSGSFNGNGHVISNLYINRPSAERVGLFGVVSGSIYKLAVEEANITANGNSGIIVGELYDVNATIESCYSTGTIAGGVFTGGLVGLLTSSSIANSYSNAAVSCTTGPRGGLVGAIMNVATVDNCYAFGAVSLEFGPAGGLVGNNGGSTITNSYYDTETSGTTQAVGWGAQSGAAGLTSAEFASEANFTSWDFSNTWQIGIIESISPIDRPYLQFQLACDSVQNLFAEVIDQIVYLSWEITTPEPGTEYFIYKDGALIDSTAELSFVDTPGVGSYVYCIEASYDWGCISDQVCTFAEVAYQPIDTIFTLEDLQWLSENPNAWSDDWVLGADIDASETASWNNGLGMCPIGDSPTEFGVRQKIPFTGTFDGQGYEISNVTINRPDEPYVGFFGQVTTGTVQNLKLTSLSVEGYRYVGGLIGYAHDNATVNNCATQGETSGVEKVGGLIGQTYQYIGINDCHTSGDVYTNMWAGGIAGDLYTYSTITNSYSKCNIHGVDYLGGIAGSNRWYSSIANSYAIGDINGAGEFNGGLVGYNDDGVVNTCYATGNVTGTLRVGGLVGESMMIENLETGIYYSYATGHVDANDFVGGLVGRSYAFVTDCYFDSETSGTTVGIGNPDSGQFATDLNTSQFANEDNFLNWDFTEVWTIFVNDAISSALRPYLNWQYSELYTLTFNAAEGGTVQGADIQQVFPGSNSAQVVASPDNYYSFVEWQDAAGNTYSTEEALIIENVEADALFTAIFETIDYYDAVFTVTDGNLPLQGATVSIDGIELATDANGIAAFELADGEYSYIVSLEGYYPASGNISISGAAVNQDVTLNLDGIQDIEARNIKVYPNPSNGEFYVELDGSCQLIIRNLAGETIYTNNIRNKASIKLNKEAAGVYFMQLKSGNSILHKRIILK